MEICPLIIVQARMGSTRLPGKVMKEVLGKPLLQYLLERLKRVKRCGELVVATTVNPNDWPILELCGKLGVATFRGSEEDVLKRFWAVSSEKKWAHIIRVTADCPLLDPKIIDRLIAFYAASQPACDYASNTLEWTYPRGMDVEIFSKENLRQAAIEAKESSEREHVTLFFKHHPDRFCLRNLAYTRQIKARLTVDTEEDFALVQKVIEAVYPDHPEFTFEDILTLLDRYPEWFEMNAHVRQKCEESS